MVINGRTEIIAHIGWPTSTFKSPMIYNPYFERIGVDCVVVPMGCKPDRFQDVVNGVFALENIRGALITMPYKVAVVGLCDEITARVKVAGSCNAVRRAGDGRLIGDMFDGEGFVRALARRGYALRGASALVVGCGGVGCAIAASLAAAGSTKLGLYDVDAAASDALARRLREQFPACEVATGSNDPAGFGIAVNATPLGMNPGDPLPLPVARLAPDTIVCDVVMKSEMTAFLAAAAARGCPVQVGTDMLFEMIPAYLEFFGLPAASADDLRASAQVSY